MESFVNCTAPAHKKAVGNFYINDKAGYVLNLLHWASPRPNKETFVTPEDYGYLFLRE